MKAYAEILHAIADGKEIEALVNLGCGITVYKTFEHDAILQAISAKSIEAQHLRVKTPAVLINGIEVPAPERTAPARNTTYHYPAPWNEDAYSTTSWDNHPADKRALARGLVHLTKEAAAIHGKALTSFTQV
jgi:hypothetical protein